MSLRALLTRSRQRLFHRALAVAPKSPDIVDVGAGDMITAGAIEQGNGVYKSVEGGTGLTLCVLLRSTSGMK